MKPDTILEALIGKIANDEDCVAANVKPETKLEKFVEKIGREFELAPRTNPMNVNSYLVSNGNNGAIWVKPLKVVFSGYDPESHCSKTYDEILSAYSNGLPIDAVYMDTDGRQYNLAASAYANDIHTLIFSNACLIPNNGDIVTLKIACSINIGNGVEIVITDGN